MGKQKTIPKPKERAGPPAPVAARKIQLTPKQLSAQLGKAKTDEELNRALKNTLNYIGSLSAEMTKGEYKQNRDLHKQLSKISNARAEEGYYPKLVDKCIEELEGKLSKAKYAGPSTPEEAVGTKEEKPMKFQQFGFFELSDFAKRGNVAFGNLPAQMAQQIRPEDRATAHAELNKLANAHFTGGNKKKAGREFLKYLEDLFNGYGYTAEEVSSAVSNTLSETPGLGDEIKNALRNGTYGPYFEHGDASFSEWMRAGTNNYLTWTSQDLKLVFSAEAAKYLTKGAAGEFGITAGGKVYKGEKSSVRSGEPGQWGREGEESWLGGGGGGVYGEVREGRWKAGAEVGAEYVPGKQGGVFIPVEAYGEVGGGTDVTSQTVRLHLKASPEVTGEALNLEGGLMWNGLFFTKGKDKAVGYIFGVRAARMSQNSDGTTNVDLVIEGQLGPTFQKLFKEKGTLIWAGIAGIVQQEIPEGGGIEGPLPQQTKVGAGVQAGVKGEKAEGFVQVQLNPITANEAVDFTGRQERGKFQGMMVNIGVKF